MKTGFIKSVLWLGLFLTASLSVGGYLGRFFWIFDLMAHFREYSFLSFVILLAGFIFLRLKWGTYLAFLGLVVLGLSIVSIQLPRHTVAAPQSEVSLFVANIKRENREYQKTMAAILDANPDVIVLIEPDQAWIDQILQLSGQYPHTIFEARDDNFGIAVFSKIELTNARIEKFGLAQVPTVVVTLDLEEESLTIVGTHPYPPFSAENTLYRDDQLLRISQFVTQQELPTVMVGDFNATPFSSIYRQMLTETNLSNCGDGFGLQRTWQRNTFLPPIPLAIDLCLATPGIEIQTFKVGPDINSDHRPLIIRLSVS